MIQWPIGAGRRISQGVMASELIGAVLSRTLACDEWRQERWAIWACLGKLMGEHRHKSLLFIDLCFAALTPLGGTYQSHL